MPTYDIDEAKSRLSKVVEQAAKGEPFVIATAGKPLMKVFALDAPEPSQQKRFGFMADQMKVSHDFNTIRAEEIHKLFGARGDVLWTPPALEQEGMCPAAKTTEVRGGGIPRIPSNNIRKLPAGGVPGPGWSCSLGYRR